MQPPEALPACFHVFGVRSPVVLGAAFEGPRMASGSTRFANRKLDYCAYGVEASCLSSARVPRPSCPLVSPPLRKKKKDGKPTR